MGFRVSLIFEDDEAILTLKAVNVRTDGSTKHLTSSITQSFREVDLVAGSRWSHEL